MPSVLLVAPPAWAATSVTPGAVTVGDTAAGSSTDYSVGFRTSSSGSLGAGSKITLTAPGGTQFSTCTLSCPAYTVTSGSSSSNPSGVSVNGSSATLTLGLVSIGNSSDVTVTITGVTNPTVTSTGDSIQESTSADTAPVASSTRYSITPAAVASVSVMSGSGQTAKTGTTFHDPLVVSLQDRYGNAEGAGIAVAFTAPSCSNSPCASATFSDGSNSETIATGTGGTAASGAVSAGSTAGRYTIVASTGALQAVFAATDAAGAVSPGTVSLSTAVEGTSGVTYTIPFTASPTGAMASGGTITTEVDQGTVLPGSSSDYSVMVGGSAVTVSSVQIPTPRLAVITLGGSVGDSAPMSVQIAGVVNPKAAGASYNVYEWTSADGGATSPDYAIAASAPASLTVVSGDNQIAAVNQQFAAPLALELKDKDSNPVPNVGVTFTVPTTSPTATFSSAQSPLTVPTGSDGVATTPALTAGSGAGSYDVSATVAASTLSAAFHLQNVVSLTPGVVALSTTQAGAPSTYTVPFTTSPTGGCQAGCTITLAAPAGTSFPSSAGSYIVAVSNGHSATVGAVSVHPGSTAVISLATSGIAAGDTVTVSVTGVGNPTVATGGYVMRESTSADSAPVPSAAYTITPAAPALIQTVLGDSQSALVFNPFPSPLIAAVTDGYGNAVPNVAVTFTAPGSMGGADFAACDGGNPSLSQCVSHTDPSGYAYAPELLAGGNSGVFDVVASTGSAQPAAFAVTVLQSGYWLVASDGGMFSHGGAPFLGSEGGTRLNKPVVGMAAAAKGGYYMVASDGGVFTFGGAPFYGSTGSMRLNAPVVGMAVDPVTGGYWLVASDGGIFNFGAPFYGSEGGTHLNKPIVGMTATPEGGYYLVASDGGIFNFGPGASFYGSEGGTPLNEPVVGMAEAPGGGYYLVASDGGIFNFGPGAVYLGSAVGEGFAPIVGMAVDPATGGYWMAASNGQVFNFGGAPFYGDESTHPLNQPIVGIAASAAP